MVGGEEAVGDDVAEGLQLVVVGFGRNLGFGADRRGGVGAVAPVRCGKKVNSC